MASKKKSPKKMAGGNKRKVGAVVIKRRGAKARLRSALKSAGKDTHPGMKDKGPQANGGQGKDAKGLKSHISRIKTKTRAITTKLTKSAGGRSRTK